MCFKTASLPAPSLAKSRTFYTNNTIAAIHIQASGTREVRVGIGFDYSEKIGGEDKATSQVFESSDLRELAAELNKLADQLDV